MRKATHAAERSAAGAATARSPPFGGNSGPGIPSGWFRFTDEPALARAVLAQRAALSAAGRLVLAPGSRLGLSASGQAYRDASP
jgi:hypothetical protein